LMRIRLGGSSSPTVPQELTQEKKPMTATPSAVVVLMLDLPHAGWHD
jgi:hypothetical protein